MKKIIPPKYAIFVPFGAYVSYAGNVRKTKDKMSRQKEATLLSRLSGRILKRLEAERALGAKRAVMKKFNMDWIYQNQMEPLLEYYCSPP